MSVQINHHSEETYRAMRAHGFEMEPASSSFVCRVGSVRWITLVRVHQFTNVCDWQASCNKWYGPVAQSPGAALAAAELEGWGGAFVVTAGKIVLLYADGSEYVTGITAQLHTGRNTLPPVDFVAHASVAGIRVGTYESRFAHPRQVAPGDTLTASITIDLGD